jgi:hypothetical protein
LVIGGSLMGLVLIVVRGSTSAEPKPDPAVERTRQQVRMLDDVYKTAVVLITEHYVNDEDDLPAGSAAKALFAAIGEKGWHEVKLLDASGEPYNDENVASDAFEQNALAQLKNGETFVDTVVERDGKRYLRAATPIPVVLEKCIMCHENYRDVPEGQPIGFLAYTVPMVE